MKKHWLVVIGSLLITTRSPCSELPSTYIVKPRDSFSSVALRFLGVPVYGKNGSVEKLERLNPQVKNPNLIFPAQVLFLSSLKRSPEIIGDEVPHQNPVLVNEVKPTTVDDPKYLSRIQLDSGFLFLRLDSTDTLTGGKGIYLSNLSPTFTFSWEQDWSPIWTTRLQMSHLSFHFMDDVESIRRLSQSAGSVYAFEFGGYRKFENFKLGFFVGRTPRLFGRALSPTSLMIDAVESTSLTGSYSQSILRRGPFQIFAGLDFAAILPEPSAIAPTSAGWNADLSFGTSHALREGWGLSGTMYYGIGEQDSNLSTKDENSLKVQFGISKELQ